MKPASYRYLFGPVPSRRMGWSLGVDLLRGKTCSSDCVFCQLGETPDCTLERAEYTPVEDVLAELQAWADAGGKADFVTLAGSGEPTLHLRFGEVLDFVAGLPNVRSALLSNGTLMYEKDVRRQARAADVLKVSLSAWDHSSFVAVNRPAPGLKFDRVLEGLQAVRGAYPGELWLEVVAVAGLNDSVEAMKRIAALASTIGPDCIHLNTVVRPPAEAEARPVSAEKLVEFAQLFRPAAEVVADFSRAAPRQSDSVDPDTVLALVQRHPCTLKDIATAYSLSTSEARSVLNKLIAEGRLHAAESRDGAVHYVAS